MTDPFATLVRQARAGSAEAASALLEQFYERIFAYFRRLTGHEEEAADLTQKTFCKVWNSLPRFDGRASFNTWLHAIAHHTYVDWRRQRNRLETQTVDWWESCLDEEPGPVEQIADREMARRLYALVDQLEEEQREAMHLHYYQGLTLQETASALDLPPSTLKYRMRQALDWLKARLAEPKLSA